MDRLYAPSDLDHYRLLLSKLSVGDPFHYYPDAHGINRTGSPKHDAKPPAKLSFGDLILNKIILTNKDVSFQPLTGISKVNDDTYDLHGDNFNIMKEARRQLPPHLASWLGSEYSNLIIAQEVVGCDIPPLAKDVQPQQLDGKFEQKEYKFELDSQDSMNKDEIEAIKQDQLMRGRANDVNQQGSDVGRSHSGTSGASSTADIMATDIDATAAPIQSQIMT